MARLSHSLVTIGPFAAMLTIYGLLLDHLQDDWFAVSWLKYVFAGLAALCVGLALRLAGEQLVGRDLPRMPSLRHDSLTVTGASSTRPVEPIASRIARCAAVVTADLRTAGHEGREMYGWSQYLGDQVSPTAIGTSYGLRLAMALDLPAHAVNRDALARSLLSMQKPGGGWAASTQRDEGRPEVTAWVLGALCRRGLDPQNKAKLVALLERLIQDDRVGLDRTTVVSVVLSSLAEVAPDRAVVRDLAMHLIDGADTAPAGDGTAWWGEHLADAGRSSVPYTARAVVALARVADVLQNTRVREAVEAGVAWLCAGSRPLSLVSEQIRRPVRPGSVDVLLVGHFTAAWVARAIGCSTLDEQRSQSMARAVREVMTSQEDGVWKLEDGLKPIWMSYQGASVLKDHAMRGLPWPP